MSEFPLQIEQKEDYPGKISALEGVSEKYYETAAEKNTIVDAIEENHALINTNISDIADAKVGIDKNISDIADAEVSVNTNILDIHALINTNISEIEDAEVSINTNISDIAANTVIINSKVSATAEKIYSTESRVIALGIGNNINILLAEDFEKNCTTNQSFSISNPILRKAFRLKLTGGNLIVSFFTGYTVHWIAGSSLEDYTSGLNNYLYCEIRSNGNVYCFFEI
jgi:dGTP triphosphohydrolase